MHPRVDLRRTRLDRFQVLQVQSCLYPPASHPYIRIMSLCITQVSVGECFFLSPWSWMTALVAIQIPSTLRFEIAVLKLGGLWFLAVLSRYLLLQEMRVIVLDVTHTASI